MLDSFRSTTHSSLLRAKFTAFEVVVQQFPRLMTSIEGGGATTSIIAGGGTCLEMKQYSFGLDAPFMRATVTTHSTILSMNENPKRLCSFLGFDNHRTHVAVLWNSCASLDLRAEAGCGQCGRIGCFAIQGHQVGCRLSSGQNMTIIVNSASCFVRGSGIDKRYRHPNLSSQRETTSKVTKACQGRMHSLSVMLPKKNLLKNEQITFVRGKKKIVGWW